MKPLKFIITSITVFWNCFVLVMAIVGANQLWKTVRLTQASSAGSIDRRIPGWNGEPLTSDEAILWFGGFVLLTSFIATLPLLGAFISHAKRRGTAEGYNLVTFFGPLGLIVALCLPTNRDSA